MTVLIVGASGLLGSNVAALAADRYGSVVGTYHTNEPDLDVDCVRCDLTVDGEPSTLVNRYDPELVVNCAAMTDVDGCEARPETAEAVNERAPGQLADVCEKRDTEFVHISTDYVFDGKRRLPYREDDDMNPLQEYGRTKASGERLVRANCRDALIARLSFVYGVNRSSGEITGLPGWITDRLKSGEEVPLFTDQYVTPTRAGQAAETLLDLREVGRSGRYHVACRNCVTPYEFGSLLVGGDDIESRLIESLRAEVERDAPRPTYTCLDVSRVENSLRRPQPTLAEDLETLQSR